MLVTLQFASFLNGCIQMIQRENELMTTIDQNSVEYIVALIFFVSYIFGCSLMKCYSNLLCYWLSHKINHVFLEI